MNPDSNPDPESVPELITDPDLNLQIISDPSGSGCTTLVPLPVRFAVIYFPVYREQPGLSAGDMAGRLAELWQSAPHEEKQAWSLKAKRLALKSGSSLKVKLLFAVLITCHTWRRVFRWPGTIQSHYEDQIPAAPGGVCSSVTSLFHQDPSGAAPVGLIEPLKVVRFFRNFYFIRNSTTCVPSMFSA